MAAVSLLLHVAGLWTGVGATPVTFSYYDDSRQLTVSPSVINKVGGSATNQDTAAARASVEFFASNSVAVTFRCSSTSVGRFLGFVHDSWPTSGSYTYAYNTMPYAFYCASDALIHVYESSWVVQSS